jgi:hypothetical protein
MSRKTIIAAFIAILILSSSLAIQITSAIATPMVPQFTIKQVDRSYDVPTTYTTNMYTGENITHPGYHVTNLTIEVTIKNQPIPTSTNGYNTTGLFYNVQTKNHMDNWPSAYNDERNKYTIKPAASEYTVVIFVLNNDGLCYALGSQVDIRVQAVTGTEFYVFSRGGGPLPIGTQFILDEASSWSNTQTITVGVGDIVTEQPTPAPSQASVQPTSSASTTAESIVNPTEAPSATTQVLPSQTPTEAPVQPNAQTDLTIGIDWKDIALAVACGIIAALAVALVLSRRKRA